MNSTTKLESLLTSILKEAEAEVFRFLADRPDPVMAPIKKGPDWTNLPKGHIVTAGGEVLNPFDPRVDQMSIDDIAHSLANQCRFNGHCARFLSVAEHSVRVASRVQETTKDPKIALTALLHDAAEAYIGDIPKPIKSQLKNVNGVSIEDHEERIAWRLSLKFGTIHPLPPVVKKADNDQLQWEVERLMPPFKFGRPYYPWTPERAKTVFLQFFRNLSGKVQK